MFVAVSVTATTAAVSVIAPTIAAVLVIAPTIAAVVAQG
jgi:hypothetical protein